MKVNLDTERLSKFLNNRELSWLSFNARVLAQAENQDTPLLERLHFLQIFRSNLDEFFMKRVGGIKRLLALGVNRPGQDGLSLQQQIVAIRNTLLPQLEVARYILINEILPSLGEEGVQVVKWKELSNAEAERAEQYFLNQVFPLLTPLAVDAGHPFPFISNLSTSLGVALSHPAHDDLLFARVKISDIYPPWVCVSENPGNDSEFRLISIQQLVQHNLHYLFPELEIIASMPFRITRNADIEIDEDHTDNLLTLVQQELQLRRAGQVVRLEHGVDANPWILNFLKEELEISEEDIYEQTRELDLVAIPAHTYLLEPSLRFPKWRPCRAIGFVDESSIFKQIRDQDILVHHPFESFSSSVERFVSEAALDPKVKSIKMTVYRVGDESPLIPLLIEAASRGKTVVCMVELKARFEEERNIIWARRLEDAGVHVAYGIPHLKTHAKTILVVREESNGIRCYAHIGTGNYNAKTAELYTDIGLFTSRDHVCSELIQLFNYLTGRSLKSDYRQLLVAPLTMRAKFLDLIQREIDNSIKGLPARIIAKMNSLEDAEVIKQLYRASQSGVQIDLIVRGVCSLQSQIPGLSENIRVISILGRLLEHSRIFYFQNAAQDPIDGVFIIGSADWMSRNLQDRIEVAVPIEEFSSRLKLWGILEAYLSDSVLSWQQKSDGTYQPPVPARQECMGVQEYFMKHYSSAPGSS